MSGDKADEFRARTGHETGKNTDRHATRDRLHLADHIRNAETGNEGGGNLRQVIQLELLPSRKSVSLPYPASANTTSASIPAARAARSWSSAICGLVWKATASGTPAAARRSGSSTHSMRQIQAISDRQTGMIIGGRQAHRDLAVVLFAELSTVMPRHTDRVLAFLRHAGVIDNQGPGHPSLPAHCSIHYRANPHFSQALLIRPRQRPAYRALDRTGTSALRRGSRHRR